MISQWFKSLMVLVIFSPALKAYTQPAASWNYLTTTGTLGTTYSWIDCSGGTNIVSGDDTQASFNWPFSFRYYDNSYTTSNTISVCTNGFLRLDGVASTNANTAIAYSLTGTATGLGQIIATAVYDNEVSSSGSGWVRFLVTGSAPFRILTIEYNNIEIDYNDSRYADIQVSFFESVNRIVLKLGSDNINASGVDMGLHSGVSGYFNKWQEVRTGTNNAWIEYSMPVLPAAASWNYITQTGNLGSEYSWIDCTSGSTVVSGDDAQASISWPFNFSFYDNNYNTSHSLSVATNGFIRLDGTASTNYTTASSYDLTASATGLGQIIATAVYDNNVGGVAGSWCRWLVTGTAPYRILTIEYKNLEIDYNDELYADVQVSFYETLNEVVLKYGDDNISASGADMGIHSGVNGYYHKWQEAQSGTNNTWIRYTRAVEVSATAGSSQGFYSSLKAAFDKINDGTHRGAITIKINGSTVETSTATLNASATGSALYTSVNIYPTFTGLSVTGNIAAPLIDLNGADNVTIDGRVNATGTTASLVLNNTSISSVSGTSTLRFINDASGNSVQYCLLKGSETDALSGVVFFSTTTLATGNDNNTLTGNLITCSANANRPLNAVYSAGTAGKDNSSNVISNNSVFDFLKHGTASTAISIAANTSSWSITGNSFYETTSFVPTGSVTYHIILVNNPAGGGFTVSGNYIGGSDAQCGGSAWTKTNAANNTFHAVMLNTGTAAATSVQNNTVRNFNWSNSGNAQWTGFMVQAGNVNMGTETGNVIGSVTGTGSVTVTGGATGHTIVGYDLGGSGIVDCENNSIGSIASASSNGAYASNITGINITNTGTCTIINNIIGSDTEAGSISAGSAATGNAQSVTGILNTTTGSLLVDGNIIANLANATTNTTAATAGQVAGITSSAGVATITNNTVFNLSNANTNNAVNQTASVIGIAVTGTGGPAVISGNVIYNLTNSNNTFGGSITGLYSGSSYITSENQVNANLIHSLGVTGGASVAASLFGIKINSGRSVYSNNIISLDNNTSVTVYGIFETGGSGHHNKLYFNTIYIGGSLGLGTANKSYCLYSAVTSNTRDFRNNILVNERSTVSGASLHYTLYIVATTGTLTVDYNDYFITGTGGMMGYFGGDKSILPVVTSQDNNSVSVDPVFADAGGTLPASYYSTTDLPGVAGTGITTDFNGLTRHSTPKMGALENNRFVWKGSISTDFGTPGNWVDGAVPADGADISFDNSPMNHCYLDQARSLRNIINTQNTYRLVVNGKRLTVTGIIDLQNGAAIDATTGSSMVTFAGLTAQSVPAGCFISNLADGLEINNNASLSLNGNLTISTSLSLTAGSLIIGDNTLTINGAISTVAGNLTGGSTTNITIGGSGTGTTLPTVSLNNLTVNRANGLTLGGNVSIAGTLTLTSGVLTVGSNIMTISGSAPVTTGGTISADAAGSFLIFSNTTAMVLPTSVFSTAVRNLTLSGSGGLTAGSGFTVNGILNLQSANPSASTGILHMGDYILDLGSNATVTGTGDVTGIVRRTIIEPNVTYTFSHRYASIKFPDVGVLPSQVSLKTTLGEAPGWKPEAAKRKYDVIQTGGSGTQAVLRTHYLESELNGNDESKLVDWSYRFANSMMVEHGRSNFSTTENWIELSNADVAYFSSSFGNVEVTLSESELTSLTWNGSVSSSWVTASNWTPIGAPSDNTIIIIPDASLTPNDPFLPAIGTCGSITLESNAILNSQPQAQLTVNGAGGAWSNQGGTFYAQNSTVIFTNAAATINGSTNFYNLSVAVGGSLTLTTDSYTGIVGALTNEGIFDATFFHCTVEYNGADQSVINTNGITSGYHNLLLSGSGTKVLPVLPLMIHGNLSISDTVNVHAGSSLTIEEDLIIGEEATFTSGNFDHIIEGDFENNGIFNAGAGKSVSFNGDNQQQLIGSTHTYFEKLEIDNTSGILLFQDITVQDELLLTAGNLSVGTTTLALDSTISIDAGALEVNEYSSLEFDGTIAHTLESTLFTTLPVLNNLTVRCTGGVTIACNLTVNGTLNLDGANASATKGLVDMWDGASMTVLTMGGNAVTIGAGDVTGIVKRNVILPNVTYSFGNRFSTVTFPEVGTLPSEISIMIKIGTAPSWKPGAVQRIYDFTQTGGSGTLAVLDMHYLDSELNGNAENKIVDWSYRYAGPVLTEHGRSNFNTTENWVGLSNANVAFFSSTFGSVEVTMDESELTSLVWNGSNNTSWVQSLNWTPNGAPSDNTIVIIPDAATTNNDPVLPPFSTCGTITLEAGAILNGAEGSELTLNGASGVWSNQGGTFNASTSNVIFTNANATLNGSTDFYSITVDTLAGLLLTTGSFTRIAGELTNNGILRAAFHPNTIEFNGTDQSLINPNGLNEGYYNLILSRSGTKTLPASELIIHGNFAIQDTVSAVCSAPVTFEGNLSIGSESTFVAGSFDHTLTGNFENNGDFTTSSSSAISLTGTSAQSISGTSTTSFENLYINNTAGVNLLAGIDINNTLTLAGGMLNVGTSTLGINGSITQLSDYINLSAASSLSFGGTDAITVQGSLFTATPVINNLTIDRTGGVTLATNITVNGRLDLRSANPLATKGSLDMFDGAAMTTLYMGPLATTTGTGDVTGIITISNIVADTTYTLGNSFSSVTFPDVGTLPAWVSIKIRIGSAPSWKPGAIKRVYDVIQSGGSGTQAVIHSHYLDSELNGNDEADLVNFSYRFSAGILTEHGRSANDETNNWVALSNVNFAFFSSSFGAVEISLSPSELTLLTWNGSISTSWITADNWTPLGAPSDNISIVIPDASTTPNNPVLPAFSTCKSVTIQSGGIVDSETNAQLTLNGAAGAWANQGGTFNSANSDVHFTSLNATVSGSTNFYNLTVNTGASLTPTAGAVTGIAGSITNNGIFNAAQTANTVIFNGGTQAIINPNGASTGYYHLTLDGSGEKSIIGKNLVIRGNLTLNNADFNTFESTIVFDGTAQSIGGSGQIEFENLVISSGSVTTVSSAGHGVRSVLTCNGTLNSGGNLTLLSTGTQTGLISGTGAGTVQGNIIMQRYIPSAFGYRYISSPFTASTVIELADDVNLETAFPSIYRYEENRDTAWWFDYSLPAGLLEPMAGYALNFGTGGGAATLDMSGVVSSGPMTVSLSNHNRSITQGFNLVGNPYPSPIDWDAESGWTRTNVDNAVYYFNPGATDQYVGSYSTYINGISSDDSAGNVIPAMQGFFVHVTDGAYPVSGSLGFSNDIRINTLNPVFHKKTSGSNSTRALVRITASYQGIHAVNDPALLLIGPDETGYLPENPVNGFNHECDAVKMMNTDPENVNFYSLVNDTRFAVKIWQLNESIDSLTVIPLGISLQEPGIVEFSLSRSELSMLYPGCNLYFHDNKNRAVIDLDKNKYPVFLEKGTADNRFSLIVTLNELETNTGSGTELSAFYQDEKIVVYIDLPNGERGALRICDLTGRLLHTEDVSGVGNFPLTMNVPAGIYIITLGSAHTIASKKLLIQ